MATTQADKPVDNGVNVEALFGAQEALAKTPEAARFKWRSTVEWINGTHSRSTIEGFYGLGAEQKHKKAFTFEADHPEVFAAQDAAATPVEIVLAGLASCLTAGVAAVAQARKVQLRSVSATLEAGMDIRGILGVDLVGHLDIKAIVAQSQKRSAVYDIITNPTNVTVEVA
jgi:uncharacterized OsmC-like protein